MDFTSIASDQVIKLTVAALAERNVEAIVVDSAADALAKIKELIPSGVSVMNGASVTLEQIGFVDYLKSDEHSWNNLHAGIVAQQDKAKQMELRKQAVSADYYLGSVHALSQTGEFVIASNTGSQLPHIVFTSPNLIFVVGAQKIVPTLASAMERLESYVVPKENEHMQQKYGIDTALNKIVIVKNENPKMGRKVRMILVREVLGF